MKFFLNLKNITELQIYLERYLPFNTCCLVYDLLGKDDNVMFSGTNDLSKGESVDRMRRYLQSFKNTLH